MNPFKTRCLTLTIAIAASALAACAPPGEGDIATDDEQSADDPDPTGDTPALPPEVTDVLDLPATPFAYDVALPQHFRAGAVVGRDNTPGDNAITADGATLGRVLFYDTALSQNRTLSCASCHGASAAFGDETAFSEGFDGGETGRNSMVLVNVRYYDNGRMFWDERAATLEEQVLGPIQDSVEMGLTLEELVARVESEDYYGPLFERAFGDEGVTSDRISRALAQFVRSMVSYRSRFDEGMAQAGDIREDFAGFTDQEALGKELFLGRARCATCHLDNPPGGGGPGGPGQGPQLDNQAIFQLRDAVNNGLDATTTDVGAGNGAFKSSSLRNIALSAPYMHDGRFDTLAEVVDFYNNGVEDHPNLDQRLRGQDGQPIRLNLSAVERDALVAFLGTLTDTQMTAEPMFLDPFIAQP